jgi:hypothetical protein
MVWSDPPPILPSSTVLPFCMDDAADRDLAKVLGLTELSPEISDAIGSAIAMLEVAETGSAQSTAAEPAQKTGMCDGAVTQFTGDRGDPDYSGLGIPRYLERLVDPDRPVDQAALARAARVGVAELRANNRMVSKFEALRSFCAWVRAIFIAVTFPLDGRIISNDEAWRWCSLFALEVLAVAGLHHLDSDVQPEEMADYLGTLIEPLEISARRC